MSDCNCNEGGICHPCYDAKCEEVIKMKRELKHVTFCLGARVKALKITPDCYRSVVENLYIYLMEYREEKS